MIYSDFDFKGAAKRELRGLLSPLLVQLSDTSDILSDIYTKHRGGLRSTKRGRPRTMS